MTKKYYLGFKASPGLVENAEKLLANRDAGHPEPYAPTMHELVRYFVPELLDAFLLQTADAVGLSQRASRIVHSASDTIAKAATALVGKLLAKRSNEELAGLVEFVDDTFLRAEICSNNADSCGCEMPKKMYDDIKRLMQEIRDGNAEQHRPEINAVMLKTVDVVLEGFMIRAISLLKINFVLRKVSDAAIVTCRGAGHMVVNKVFKNLDEEQLRRLADYFDDLLLEADR
ncbi:MAG: hypothetical protein R3208_15530 [Ketobacteraceae bacterium]|nr:hypothetical protein [Ketobacteraceae bacterium]